MEIKVNDKSENVNVWAITRNGGKVSLKAY